MFYEGRLGIYRIVLSWWLSTKSKPIHNIFTNCAPFPLQIHFHMDFHSTKGLLMVNCWKTTDLEVVNALLTQTVMAAVTDLGCKSTQVRLMR